MRSAYETQLAAVNSYIQDAQNYLKQNPDDEDARQHLMEANEQREMLYQMALDHVQ
jgi:ribosomal protein S15P/S13E